MSEQGTFWEGIPTTPYRHGRLPLSDEARHKRQLEAQRRWRANNPDAVQQANHGYRTDPKNRDRLRGYDCKRRTNPKRQANQRKRNRTKAGILNATGEVRQGTCPICGAVDALLRPDHDHNTGILRDWICDPCNLPLTEHLQAVIESGFDIRAYFLKGKTDYNEVLRCWSLMWPKGGSVTFHHDIDAVKLKELIQ